MSNLSASGQQALLPAQEPFIPEPEPAYLSEWDEDAAALPEVVSTAVEVPVAARGPYSL